jgi:hypothetical protein
MSQEIKIGVDAQVSKGEAGIRKLEGAADGVAEGFKKAADQARKLDDNLRRLQATRAILSKELGRGISDDDAGRFLDNFDKMRSGRGVGGRRVKAFDDFEGWYKGHGSSFSRAGAAEAHRRFVLSVGMQGTRDADRYGAPDPMPPGGGGGGGGRGGGGGAGKAAGLLGSVARSAGGFALAGLALAGIGSLSSMASRGLELSKSELFGTDLLKRQLGDRGVDFNAVRDASRAAGLPYGIAPVQANELGRLYATAAGNVNGADLASGRYGASLAQGIGLSRAFGLDPSEGVHFLGAMRSVGAAGGAGDAGDRRLAGMIANAIEQSGFGGKAGEFLSQIASYTEVTARASLATVNVAGYAGLLGGLTRTGLPGLDPTGAAALISTADANIRRGGAFGEASQNFNYMALLRENPGMSPIEAQALLQGGLLATKRSVFGSGALKGLYRGKLDDRTNLQNIRDLTRDAYGSGEFGIEAFANNTGLTLGQASALMNVQSITPAMAKDLGIRENEKNDATLLRESLAGLETELTRVGNALQGPIEQIRDLMTRVAEALDPTKGTDPVAVNYARGDINAGDAAGARWANTTDKKHKLGRILSADTGAFLNYLEHGRSGNLGGHRTGTDGINFIAPDMPGNDLEIARRTHLTNLRRWIQETGQTDAMLGLPIGSTYAQIKRESGFNPAAVGPMTKYGRAMGMAQIMPGTLALYKDRFRAKYGHDPDPWNPEDAILLNRMIMTDDMKTAHGNQAQALSLYNSGHMNAHNSQTTAYVAAIMGTPMPAGASAAGAGPPPTNVNVTLAHDGIVTLVDTSGAQRGSVTLKPVVPPTPAGGS